MPIDPNCSRASELMRQRKSPVSLRDVPGILEKAHSVGHDVDYMAKHLVGPAVARGLGYSRSVFMVPEGFGRKRRKNKPGRTRYVFRGGKLVEG